MENFKEFAALAKHLREEMEKVKPEPEQHFPYFSSTVYGANSGELETEAFRAAREFFGEDAVLQLHPGYSGRLCVGSEETKGKYMATIGVYLIDRKI